MTWRPFCWHMTFIRTHPTAHTFLLYFSYTVFKKIYLLKYKINEGLTVARNLAERNKHSTAEASRLKTQAVLKCCKSLPLGRLYFWYLRRKDKVREFRSSTIVQARNREAWLELRVSGIEIPLRFPTKCFFQIHSAVSCGPEAPAESVGGEDLQAFDRCWVFKQCRTW